MSGTKDTRFPKGKSGNPNGRPRKTVVEKSVFDVLFDHPVNVTVGGEQREVTQEEALVGRLLDRAYAGSPAASRKIMRMILEQEEARGAKAPPPPPIQQRIEPVDPENAFEALQILGIAKPHPFWSKHGDQTGLCLETWAVQMAIDRHPRRQWTDEDIKDVARSADDTNPPRWPDRNRR